MSSSVPSELEIRLARAEERVRELEVALKCAEVERDTAKNRNEVQAVTIGRLQAIEKLYARSRSRSSAGKAP